MQTAPTDVEQHEAASAIGAFGADADPAVPKLVELLDDRSPEYRHLISYWILAQIAPDAKSVVPAMIKLLKDKRARDPNDVIEVIQYAGPRAKDAVPVLTDALADDKLAMRAIRGAFAIGPAAKGAIPAIGKAVRKLDDDENSIGWLNQLGPDAVPLLCELLDEKSSSRKISAIESIKNVGSDAKSAVPQLAKLVKHNDEKVRLASAQALWALGKHPDAVPALVALLEDGKTFDVIHAAIVTLGEIGPEAKAALPALRVYVGPNRGFYGPPAREAVEKIEGTEKSKENP